MAQSIGKHKNPLGRLRKVKSRRGFLSFPSACIQTNAFLSAKVFLWEYLKQNLLLHSSLLLLTCKLAYIGAQYAKYSNPSGFFFSFVFHLNCRVFITRAFFGEYLKQNLTSSLDLAIIYSVKIKFFKKFPLNAHAQGTKIWCCICCFCVI